MSLADGLIILLLAIFALAGFRRGLVWELLTAIGLLAGFAFTYYYREELLGIILRLTRPGWERQWGGALIFLVLFVVVYAGFTLLGSRAHKAIETTPLKWADRILGIAAGLFKGAVLLGLFVVAVDWVDMEGRVRRFLWDSQLIRWGRHAVYNATHWESRERRRMVLEDMDAGGRQADVANQRQGGAA